MQTIGHNNFILLQLSRLRTSAKTEETSQRWCSLKADTWRAPAVISEVWAGRTRSGDISCQSDRRVLDWFLLSLRPGVTGPWKTVPHISVQLDQPPTKMTHSPFRPSDLLIYQLALFRGMSLSKTAGVISLTNSLRVDDRAFPDCTDCVLQRVHIAPETSVRTFRD